MQQYADALLVFVAGSGAAVALSALLAEPALRLLAGNEFAAASPAVWLLFASAFAYGAYLMAMTGLQITQRTGFITLATAAAAIVNLAANLVLIPGFGLVGAAVATLLAYLASTIGLIVINQRLTPIPYSVRQILVLGLGSICAAYAVASIDNEPVRVLIVCGTVVAVVLQSRLPAARLLAFQRQTGPPEMQDASTVDGRHQEL